MLKRSVLFVLFLLANLSLIAQQGITGAVKDEGGQPMSGVAVVVPGTNVGVMTDTDGRYSLQAPAGATTLQFSFIGYATQEVGINGRSVIDVTMTEIVTGLDEIVVIGYGTQKKKLVTGATVQVKGEDMEKLSTVSAVTALQGQTPGLNIIKSTGQPGSSYSINIRGAGTIFDAQPLYVIDGVVGGSLDQMAPADIESVDILKDAASQAIYGARGANGVILVTTKKGVRPASGVKANISYDGSYGVQNVYKMMPMMNAQEYAAIVNEARVNSSLLPYDYSTLVPNWDQVESGEWKGTNWLDLLSNKNAPVINNALNITGGSEAGTYSMGVSHSLQEGIFGSPVASNYERFTFRLNSDYTIIKAKSGKFDILKMGQTLRYVNSNNHGVGVGNQYWNDIFSCIAASPLLPMYAEDEADLAYPYHYSIPLNEQAGNPIANMIYNRGHNESKNHNLNGSFYAEIQPIKNLVFKTLFGYAMGAGSYRQYVPVYRLSATDFRSNDAVNQSLNVGYEWSLTNTLTYNFKLGSDHSFTALLGHEARKYNLGESVNVTGANSIFGDFLHAYIRNAQVVDVNLTTIDGTPYGEGGMLSYFGRLSYSFREKYLATAILRADGSSNFMEGHRWGYFPSISLGWVISEEDFFSNVRGVDFLKLRASWGQNGNSNIPTFNYLATISFSNVNYFFGPDKAVTYQGGYPDILPNPDVTWETNDQISVGIDARFLKNKLSAEFDIYSRTTVDWLVNAPVLATYGTNAPFINGGDVNNKGVELALNYNDFKGDFEYSAGFNISYNKNKVVRLANSEGVYHGLTNVLGQGTDEMYRAEVGFPIGYFWGYKTLGVFQNEAEVDAYRSSDGTVIQPTCVPGDLIFHDADDNGVINYEDKGMIGDPNPDVILGLNFSLRYKGFDLNVMANGAFGHQIARSWRRWADSPLNNYTTEIFDRWHGEGTSNRLPRLTYGAHNNWQYVSDIFVEDADYLRIANVNVGYDLKKLIKAMPLSQARIYIAGQNLYTFTGYYGMDPEIGGGAGADNWARGIDIGYYPAPRTVLIGASLKF